MNFKEILKLHNSRQDSSYRKRDTVHKNKDNQKITPNI